MNNPFKSSGQYSFEVHASAILGNDFRNVRVLIAGMDAQSAIRDGEDIISLHQQIYPLLPEGSTSSNYAHQEFIKILTSTGTTRTLALSWIRLDTVQENTNSNLLIEIENVTPEDQRVLAQAISQLGLRIVSTQIVT